MACALAGCKQKPISLITPSYEAVNQDIFFETNIKKFAEFINLNQNLKGKRNELTDFSKYLNSVIEEVGKELQKEFQNKQLTDVYPRTLVGLIALIEAMKCNSTARKYINLDNIPYLSEIDINNLSRSDYYLNTKNVYNINKAVEQCCIVLRRELDSLAPKVLSVQDKRRELQSALSAPRPA